MLYIWQKNPNPQLQTFYKGLINGVSTKKNFIAKPEATLSLFWNTVPDRMGTMLYLKLIAI